MAKQLAYLNKYANTTDIDIRILIWLNIQEWIPERVTYYSKGTDNKMIKPSAVKYRWHIIFPLLYMSLYNQDTWRITYRQITTWDSYTTYGDIFKLHQIKPNKHNTLQFDNFLRWAKSVTLSVINVKISAWMLRHCDAKNMPLTLIKQFTFPACLPGWMWHKMNLLHPLLSACWDLHIMWVY